MRNIMPTDWKYVIKKDTKAQFKVLKDLMNFSFRPSFVHAQQSQEDGEEKGHGLAAVGDRFPGDPEDAAADENRAGCPQEIGCQIHEPLSPPLPFRSKIRNVPEHFPPD